MSKPEDIFSQNNCKELSSSDVKNGSADQELKYDPLFYCRTCANKETFFVPIFKGEGLNHQLNKKIEKYLPINVTEDDDLPLQLCYNCASAIIAWDTLIIGCLEAEKKLRSLKNSTRKYICGANNNNDLINEVPDKPCVAVSDNTDSDDEPLIFKKFALVKNLKNKMQSKKDILEEKYETPTSLQNSEVHADRRTMSSSRHRIKKLINMSRVLDKYKSRSNGARLRKIKTLKFNTKKIHCNENERKETDTGEHSDDSKYRCPVCFRTFCVISKFCEDLYSHLEEKKLILETTEISEHRCRICREFFKIEELPTHLQLHINSRQLMTSEGRVNVDRKKKMKKEAISKDIAFKSTCEICGKNISRKYTMKRHLITHSGEKRFTCHHCGKQYAQESGLQRHMSVIHEGIRKYKCPICSKIFGSNLELKTHQYTHTDPRPFQCDQCGRTFVSQKHLYHHHKYHHTANGLRQLCKICNKYFSSPGVLKRHHKVIHLGLKEFQCHICSAKLSTKQYLQEHLKIHTDERPEICSFCGKTFQMAGNLRQHIKIHMEKTKICEICGKGFTRRCHLLTHMGSHKGFEQPQCEHCPRRFMLKVDLEKHMKTDHNHKRIISEDGKEEAKVFLRNMLTS